MILQNISKRVVLSVLTNISHSNIFQIFLLTEIYKSQAIFGCYGNEWLNEKRKKVFHNISILSEISKCVSQFVHFRHMIDQVTSTLRWVHIKLNMGY